MDMPKPTDAHKKLEKLAGTWRGEETMHPSPLDPQGGTAEASLSSRVGLDGFAVIGDYEQSRGGHVTFRGHSVFTFDAAKDEYVLHWFDVMGQGADQFRGRFEGDSLTLTQAGPRGQNRMTYTFTDDGRMNSKMEMSPDGTRWSTLFEGVYTRVG
jgi:hypothetical protein